jgi:hypothetical protein
VSESRSILLQLLDQREEVLYSFLLGRLKLRDERISYRLGWTLAVNEFPDAGADLVQRVETVNLPYLVSDGTKITSSTIRRETMEEFF